MGEHTAIAWTDATFALGVALRAAGGDLRAGAPSARKWASEGRDGRRRVFCSSMADIFEDHPTIDAEREKLWPLIRATPYVDWQLLTKRAARMRSCVPTDWGAGYPNVWLGVSVENQATADERIPLLLETPAAVRFVSYEPALGPVDFGYRGAGALLVDGGGDRMPPQTIAPRQVDWLIVGGESGPGARPFDVAWARAAIAQCRAARVPVFVHQFGSEWSRLMSPRVPARRFNSKGGDPKEWPEDLRVREFPARGDAS